MDKKEYEQGYQDGIEAIDELSAEEMSIKNIDYKCGFVMGFTEDSSTHMMGTIIAARIGELTRKYNIPLDHMVEIFPGKDYQEYYGDFKMGYDSGSGL